MFDVLAKAWYRTNWLWIFEVWQIPLFLLLIGLVLYWRRLRNKQV
jgi:hypothetical protein